MKRGTFRILLAFLVLLAVAAAGVQVVLLTDLPRQWVMQAAGQKLGMTVTAGSLRTDPWGRTTIKDLALSLPMEDGPILVIPELRISHSSIPLTVLRRSLTLRSVTIVNPQVNVRQNDAGSWNVQEFVSCLQAVAAGSEGNRQERTLLPELNVANGTVSITTRSGQSENVGPVRFCGGPKGTARWDFEMHIASEVTLSGKVAAGAGWAHEIDFDVRSLNELAGNLMPGGLKPLRASGRFYGRVSGDELTSRLKLEQLEYDRMQAHGILGIDISKEKSRVHFETLSVEGLEGPIGQIRIAGGSIQADGKQLQAQHIGVETGGILGSITGHWSWGAREGTLAGSWSGQTAKPYVRHEGTLNGSVSWPQIGTRRASVLLTTQGTSPSGRWQGELNVLGSGHTWSNSQWKVSVPRLLSSWKDGDVTLEDVQAEIAADWPKVQLESLSAANVERLKAEGFFSAEGRDWAISLAAEGFRPNKEQSLPIDLRFSAEGGPEHIGVREFRMTAKGMSIESAGKIALPSTELHDAHAKASWMVQPATGRGGFGNISGNLQCEAAITGTLRPMNLRLQSVLLGENVTFHKKVIGSVTIPCQAQIDTRQIKYKTDSFELFGGVWAMEAEHDFSERSTQLALDANEVLLQHAAELFDLPLACQGSVAAHLAINLPWSDVNEVTVSGRWDVDDMVIPPIEADRAAGRIRIHGGIAVFDQIHLERNQGLASASARFRLDEPQYVSVEAMAQRWPTSLPNHNVTFITDGRGQALLDLSKRTGQGAGKVSSDVVIDDKQFAHISAEVAAEGRTVNLNEMRIAALGGAASGAAQIPLDDRLAAGAELQWRDLEAAALVGWWPGLEGLAGKLSGSLTAAKTDRTRPLEPLHLEIRANMADGAFRGARIGGCQVSAYLGEERLLIDQSEFEVMDGVLSASGSLRRRTGRGSAYMRADFSELELGQLVHLFLPSASPVQGRLSGTGFLVVLSGTRGMTGQADVQLSESDLGRTVVVGTLYDAMNLKFGSDPSGQGQISMRFEGSSLKIPSFTYFNRGAEIRGAGSIDDLTQGKTSPVGGYAIGSIRPLKGIRLPGVKDLDRLMASLQTGVSSVRIQGTLADPQAEAVPFREIGQALRALLWSQLGE